jgi:hypothetical protein
MKKLIDFFKKLFGYKQVCPKCKNEPYKCELEVPVEHIRVVEDTPVKEEGYQVEFQAENPIVQESAVVKPKKKRAPRKKKSETVTK